MKATIKLFTVTILATLFISAFGRAQIDNHEEGYIDDIPFNTHEIALETSFERSLAEFTFEEEEYVDDIPFNTEAIASEACCDRVLQQKYSFEEEEYVDDIPFNTADIARQLLSTEEPVPMTYNCDKEKTNRVL